LIVGWCGRFLFFVVLPQFSQVVGEWPENQILIPDWSYFHCPGATLLITSKWLDLLRGAGTILEFDLASNILPMAETYKTVLDIDTAITAIDAPYRAGTHQHSSPLLG